MRLHRTLSATLVSLATVASIGCSGDPSETAADPALAVAGQLALTVVLPAETTPGLAGAAEDLVAAAATITGTDVRDDAVRTADAPEPRVVVHVADDATLGPEAYVLTASGATVTVTASTPVGAMYGLYHVAADMGVRYHHPEQTWFPSDPDAALPLDYDGTIQAPDFAWRGFHEHTQHPIEMSDFLLRPEQEFRPYVSRYIRWLARNRQNTMSWQMLKTVELDAWLPYIESIIDEADGWGVNVGMVTSFVDQQQNMYRMVREEELGGEGQPADDEAQLRAELARWVDAGFDFLVTQIGSSEFTKPADEDVLRWMAITSEVLGDAGIPYWTWIHTTCDLEADDGGYFYHLPLQADAGVGAWLHTTMFYNLRDPAPVYYCEDFSHQRQFAEQADGERSIVYFPETAWWLGFDSNLPLALPITGRSREADIREILPAWDVEGHVTFTTGREWTYWQYDHFLTRATWDRDFTWADYLDWIAPVYGAHGAVVRDALQAWTDLQWSHFYEDDPLLIFYLAGELRQDEIGARAGILARRPKLAFSDVVAMDDDAYAAWQAGDLARLRAMRDAYAAVFAPLPAPDDAGTELTDVLYAEVYETLYVYVRRLDHVLALYETLDPVRQWSVLNADGTGDTSARDALLAQVQAGVQAAEAITSDVLAILVAAEGRYRFPVEILARSKPESPTAYPYGYLEQTSTGHFWVRRDEQLEVLVGRVFGTAQDEWADTAPDRLFVSDADNTTLVEPDHPLAGSVITGFLPQTLFGLSGAGETAVLTLALDANSNLLPDPGSEARFATVATATAWSGTVDAFTLSVSSATGEPYGDVSILDAHLDVTLEDDVPTTADLSGAVPSQEMVGLVVSVGGIDEEGAANLLKSVFGFAPDEEMTATLPIHFRFALRAP